MAYTAGSDVPRQIRVMDEALARHFGPHLGMAGIRGGDAAQKHRTLLSRALAALVVRDRVGSDVIEAANTVTDGANDHGIDAIGIAPASHHLHFVQAKWSDSGQADFGERDVLAIENALQKIDRNSFTWFNKKIQAMAPRISAIWGSPDLKVTVSIAVIREDALHPRVQHRLSDLEASVNRLGAYLDIEVLRIDEIWEMVRRVVTPAPLDLPITLVKWFDVTTPMSAFNGLVSTADVAKWYEQHRNLLFAKNLREPLGVTDINASIAESLVNAPEEFWYRNNGIIMLCDSATLTPGTKLAPHGSIRIDAHGASIVNGAQTVAAIVAAAKRNHDAVQQALVGLRLIVSASKTTGHQITLATNTQNRVERRDFVALDEAQLALREEFSLSLGLAYAIRRGELEPSPESGCTVREAAVALACEHTNPELAVRARKREELLWEEGPQGAYHQIFGGRPSAVHVWRAVCMLRAVRNALHREQYAYDDRLEAVAQYGDLVIAHLVFQRLGRDVIDSDSEVDWQAALSQTSSTVDAALRWMAASIDRLHGKRSLTAPVLAEPDRVRELVAVVRDCLAANVAVPDLPAVTIPSQRTRRQNTVHMLVDDGRINDGTPLEFVTTTDSEFEAMAAWFADDPRRRNASWVNDRAHPLVWAGDGQRHSASGLTLHMWEACGWSGAPVAVQGPAKWRLHDGPTLLDLAESIWREAEASTDDVGAES